MLRRYIVETSQVNKKLTKTLMAQLQKFGIMNNEEWKVQE